VKLWTPPGYLEGLANELCAGELEVGKGRIRFTCPRAKYRFDAARSNVKEVRREANIYGDGWNVLITLRNAKKTRTFEFEATDRLGGTEAPAPLLDAILQAMGK
jgi:hypothetical protein